jgi:hypothetical protein
VSERLVVHEPRRSDSMPHFATSSSGYSTEMVADASRRLVVLSSIVGTLYVVYFVLYNFVWDAGFPLARVVGVAMIVYSFGFAA